MGGLTSILLLLLPFLIGASPKSDPSPPADAPECLAYDPEIVRLSGIIERRTFPGAPGSGEDQSSDAREAGWILRLFEPICTAGEDDGLEQSESNVREVQVVVREELFHALHAITGRPVTITGTLFHSHSGHHHTPVLILLQDLSSNDSRDPGPRSHPAALLAVVDAPPIVFFRR